MGKDPSAITASREAFYAADPIDRVLAVFDLGCNHAGKPFVPTHKQVESVNLYGHVNGHGCWDRPGTGKTLTMTLHALLAMCEGTHKQCVVLTPPAVIPNWCKFLRGIMIRATGQPVTVVDYLGPHRWQTSLMAHFIVMSYEVFKKDYEYLTETLFDRMHNGVTLICDDAHKIKNMASAN